MFDRVTFLSWRRSGHGQDRLSFEDSRTPGKTGSIVTCVSTVKAQLVQSGTLCDK